MKINGIQIPSVKFHLLLTSDTPRYYGIVPVSLKLPCMLPTDHNHKRKISNVESIHGLDIQTHRTTVVHNIIQFNIEAFKMNRLSVDALYRISTTEVERYELIRCAKPGRSGAIDQVKELLGDVFVECKELTLWCKDNARREFLVLCDENGLDN